MSLGDWQAWWDAVAQQGAALDLLTLALCGLLAWVMTAALRRALPRAQTGEAARAEAEPSTMSTARRRPRVLLGGHGLQGILFPLLWLLLTWSARAVIVQWQPAPVLRVALPVLMALVVIRTSATMLRAAFPGLAAMRALERTISWAAWAVLVLWVSGALPLALGWLDSVTWRVGGNQISIRMLIEGALTAGVLILLALWASSAIEARLLRSAFGYALSLRKVIANAVRAFMVFVGLLMGMSAVGIDLTALSVLGGAIGVGIGLGLQKLAANYVSGFMVLAEHSVRIGDLVRVGGLEGRITDIRMRYTVIRAGSGSEAIIPNETLMTTTVENLSLSDTRVYQSVAVSVGYDSDPDLVLRLLTEAALECPRTLREPAAFALLAGFGADGLDFTVGYWIADPENGLGGPRSQINLAILRKLRAHGIDIPYPQRVLHMAGGSASAAQPGGGQLV
jgi:small-conductance mechanosensitive channel